MRGLRPMTLANTKSFVRDRSSLFWTMAFPVLLIVLFGAIFSGGTSPLRVAWVDEDNSPASAQLRAGFAQVPVLDVRDAGHEEALELMRNGEVVSVLVVPPGLARAVADGPRGDPFRLVTYVDPTRQMGGQTIEQIVNQLVGATNLAIAGAPPTLAVERRTLQTDNLTAAAFFVPSILAMALMQLGLFAAVPLVAQREKLILKRLAVTPLTRATLVGSNVLMRLLIALAQTALIVGVGTLLFGVAIVGNLLVVGGIIVLGALTFLAIGYVVASFATTEESASNQVSVLQFPLMFLSGIFFQVEFMPDFLQPVVALMPLTYLADALRQTMVGGAAYVPLELGVAILVGWLVASFAIAARFFRWQ